jgi:3-oxoacyl-[acyl-carrier protein] reductase
MTGRMFEDRLAIVTGAAGGIGRATARMLAQQGAAVIGLDLDADGLKETWHVISDEIESARVLVEPADVTDRQAAATAVQRAVAGRPVHMLFNIAGIIRAKPLLESSTPDVLELMEANVGSLVTMTNVVAPLMPPGGVIVNTSSSAAGHFSPGQGIYGASKLAVVYLTKALAGECAELGIRVCAVGPGAVDTQMPRRMMAHLPDREAVLQAAVERSQLITRLAQPEEIAAAMCYLASDEAGYCTGTTLWIDGGAGAR